MLFPRRDREFAEKNYNAGRVYELSNRWTQLDRE